MKLSKLALGAIAALSIGTSAYGETVTCEDVAKNLDGKTWVQIFDLHWDHCKTPLGAEKKKFADVVEAKMKEVGAEENSKRSCKRVAENLDGKTWSELYDLNWELSIFNVRYERS